MEMVTWLLITKKWELKSVVCGEPAGAETEKPMLVGVLKEGLFPARPLLRIYLTGISADVHSDRAQGCSLHHCLKYWETGDDPNVHHYAAG